MTVVNALDDLVPELCSDRSLVVRGEHLQHLLDDPTAELMLRQLKHLGLSYDKGDLPKQLH